MAIDFGILERTPSIASRFMAGQEAAQEQQTRNMLLQQKQLQFQQAQQDRQRALQQEAQFENMAGMIRQHGMDPDDPQVLRQFVQAALQSRNPQLVAFASQMSERAAKRRQLRAESEAVRNILGGPAAALEAPSAPAGAAPIAEMPAAAPVVAPTAAAPAVLSDLARDQAGQLRPRGYAQGQFINAEPTGVAFGAPSMAVPTSVEIGPSGGRTVTEIDVANLRRADTDRAASVVPTTNALPVNALAPEPAAAPVNAMVAPAAAPSVQVAGPAALPAAAPKVDVAALETQLEGLQAKYDQLTALGTTAGNKAAATLKPQMDRISRQIERATKATETAPAELRMMDALGIPRTEAGFARFNELKQRPEAMSSLARLIAERDKLAPNDPSRKLYDDAIKKATTQVEPAKVEVKLPPQPRKEQEARGALLVEQYKGVADTARIAARTLPALETQERILDSGFKTGFGTDAQKAGASLLSALGVPEATKFATNAQTFLSATQQAVLQRQLEQKGPQTEADAQRITQTGAQLGNTPEANRFIIAVAKAQLKRDIAQRNFYDKWWKDNGTYDGAEDAWFTGEGGKSLFDSAELKSFAPAPRAPAGAPATKGRSVRDQADAIISGGKP